MGDRQLRRLIHWVASLDEAQALPGFSLLVSQASLHYCLCDHVRVLRQRRKPELRRGGALLPSPPLRRAFGHGVPWGHVLRSPSLGSAGRRFS